MSAAPRLKEAQENIKKITADKRVETKKINANSLVRCSLQSAGRGRTSFCVNTSATDIHDGYIPPISPTERETAPEAGLFLRNAARAIYGPIKTQGAQE